MMEQRSQMLRQMRLSSAERQREVSFSVVVVFSLCLPDIINVVEIIIKKV